MKALRWFLHVFFLPAIALGLCLIPFPGALHAWPEATAPVRQAARAESPQACWQKDAQAKALVSQELFERFILSAEPIPPSLAEQTSRELLHALERIVQSWKNPEPFWSDALGNLLTDAAVLQRPYAPRKEFWLTLEKSVHLRLHTALTLLHAQADTLPDSCPARFSLLMARLYPLDPLTERGLLSALLIDYARRTNPRLERAWDSLARYSPKAAAAWLAFFDLAAGIDEKTLRETPPEALALRVRLAWNTRNGIATGDPRRQAMSWALPLLPVDLPARGTPCLPVCTTLARNTAAAASPWPEELYLWVEPSAMKDLAQRMDRALPVFSGKEALEAWRDKRAFVETLAQAPQAALLPLAPQWRARMVAERESWLDLAPVLQELPLDERGNPQTATWTAQRLVCQTMTEAGTSQSEPQVQVESLREPTRFQTPRLWPFNAQGNALVPPPPEEFLPVPGVFIEAETVFPTEAAPLPATETP